MKRYIGVSLAVLTMTSVLAAQSEASAASAERAYTLRTRMVEQSPSVGEFDGALQLRIAPDGIVSGYYRPDDNARFIAVTGGLTGERLWLDIGSFSRHPWHFTGTFKSGTIDASSSNFIFDDGRYTSVQLLGKPRTS